MSDETTLLLCPFCGEEPWEPIPKRWTNAIGDESWSASVHCPECEITVKTECVYETAEAAIEAAARKWNTRATVGNGTLTVEQVEKAISDCCTYASYDGCTYYASGIRLQAIADELSAELGSGTCELELNTDMTAIRCDKCGYELPKGTDLKATRFCCGCGRRAW